MMLLTRSCQDATFPNSSVRAICFSVLPLSPCHGRKKKKRSKIKTCSRCIQQSSAPYFQELRKQGAPEFWSFPLSLWGNYFPSCQGGVWLRQPSSLSRNREALTATAAKNSGSCLMWVWQWGKVDPSSIRNCVWAPFQQNMCLYLMPSVNKQLLSTTICQAFC